MTLNSGRRNCNYTFANLLGWQFLYKTEVCVLQDTVVLRYIYEGEHAYSVCTADNLTEELIKALLADSGGKLIIYALEDSQVSAFSSFKYEVESLPYLFDYIYRRTDLAMLQGGHLQAKRNHVNRFRADNPDFEYRPLTPELFDECRRLTEIWQGEKGSSETIDVERQVMETIFSNWESLGMIGGSIFVNGRMVAFSYGAAVTNDTFDICVEKADRNIEGAFATINQQFASHLPEQYIYVNREDDMGLPGLRKSKLSYHPEILLSFNVVRISMPYTLHRMTPADAPLTVDWMVRQYGFDRAEVETWVRDLHFNWPLSVKAIDNDGKVIGLLNMSDYRIEEETEQILKDAPELLASLNAQRYTAVFSFIVAPDYCGTRLNYDMLMSIMPELKSRYDYIFIPVMHRLKTHTYWQRWGATEFYRDSECVCYKLLPSAGASAETSTGSGSETTSAGSRAESITAGIG
ncbi:MAG: DUF2156 domain-containing protein [Bacteroidaceae bacterium]|nr:DUF2156 domain-containing protein [Bacteroidaceae bacterium]